MDLHQISDGNSEKVTQSVPSVEQEGALHKFMAESSRLLTEAFATTADESKRPESAHSFYGLDADVLKIGVTGDGVIEFGCDIFGHKGAGSLDLKTSIPQIKFDGVKG